MTTFQVMAVLGYSVGCLAMIVSPGWLREHSRDDAQFYRRFRHMTQAGFIGLCVGCVGLVGNTLTT